MHARENTHHITERWLPGPHGLMRYHVSAARPGPPLVLLHGFGAMIEIWHRALHCLAPHATCYVPDLYGFGYSAALQRPDKRIWVEQVATLLREVVREPAVLVGNSLGGMVAAQVARAYPQQVRALALVDSTGLSGTARLYSKVERFFYGIVQTPGLGEVLADVLGRPFGVRQFLVTLYYRKEQITPHLVTTLSGPFRRPHTARFCLRVLRDFERLALDVRPGEIAAPALLLWGEHDPVLPPLMAYRLQTEIIPHADIRIIPQSGHCPFDETPEAFCATLLSWLDSALP
jgi:pimeloyl-ACP methyl ester carboxylesterase